MLRDDRCRAVELILRHADLLQRRWCADTYLEIVQALRGILRSESIRDDVHGLRSGFTIECDDMREDHCVYIGVRQAECSTKDVTDIVMNGHAHRTQHNSRQ